MAIAGEKYRVNTLDGAKRKAKLLGHEGAFFAWESQETGDDACTLFNVTDIFTNRPQRTYFKDKQTSKEKLSEFYKKAFDMLTLAVVLSLVSAILYSVSPAFTV